MIVKDILYLTAVLNSCINPVIYGAYYFSDRRLTQYPSKKFLKHTLQKVIYGVYYFSERRLTRDPSTNNTQHAMIQFSSSRQCSKSLHPTA